MTSAAYQVAAGAGPASIGSPTDTPWEPAPAGLVGATGRAVTKDHLLDDPSTTR
jgi:hypothetical protein